MAQERSFYLCFLTVCTVSRPFDTDCPSLRKGKESINPDRRFALPELSAMFEHTGGPIPDSRILKVDYFFQELYRLNIWPIPTRCTWISLGHIQKEIDFFDEQEYTTFKSVLKRVTATAINAQKGVCLACRKKGKVSSHQLQLPCPSSIPL